MKIILLLILTITATLSAPIKENIAIVKYENTGYGIGSYRFSYKTSDGTFREEIGVLRNAEDSKKAYIAVNGSYSYIGTDGKTYTVIYAANEYGFQPSGEHISVPETKKKSIPLPPVPPPRLVTKLPPIPPPYAPKATQRPPAALPPEVARSLLGVEPE